jgi:DNA-binding LacI/PurR family transcriptional regulator
MATTSRVLSGGPINTRPATRARVLEAAQALGYVWSPRERGRVLRRVHQARQELRLELAIRIAAAIARLTVGDQTMASRAEVRGLRIALEIVSEEEQ